MYFVYILACDDDTLYTGITTNLERRFLQHKNGKGANYTRSRNVLGFVYVEQQNDRSSALKREAEIKSWNKTKKVDFIARQNVLLP